VKYLSAVRRFAKISTLFFLTVFLTYSCSVTETLFEKKLEFPTARLEIKVTSTPSGQADLGAGQVMTFAEAKSLKSNGTKIRIPKSSGKSTSVVAAKFGNEIRLLDFVIPGEREQPELSFESTARSLVFMNPIFSSLSFEQRVSVFKAVSKNSKFQELVKLVSESQSILDEKAIDLSTDIALSVAKSLFGKSSSVSTPSKPSPTVTAAKPVTPVKPNNSDNPFDKVQFPKPVCGDSLPSDPKAYPVKLYPVFVDYSESNLQTVKSKFCQDALPRTREKTGKQALQVGSFLTIDRANAFKEFMLKNIGSGEVGDDPTVIESQPTSKINSAFKNLVAANNMNSQLGLFDWLMPPANAQSGTNKIKYEIAKQLDRNSVLLGQDTPVVLHGLELESTSDGIKISGTTPVAQQVLVLPAGKFPPFKQVTSEDYKNGGTRESDIVAEEIFLSTDINLPFIDNQLPSEPFSELLKPKTGSWKPGTYDVIMSPSIKYNRNGKYEFGAYNWNSGVAVINFLAAIDTWLDLNQLKAGGNKIGGNATETPKEKMIRIVTKLNKANLVRDDCHRDLIKQKEGDNSSITLMNCPGKPGNLFQIASIVYDVDGDKIVSELFGKLFDLQGKQHESLKNKVGKGGNLLLTLGGAGKNTYTSFMIGESMTRDLNKGPYIGQFTVTEIPPDPALVALSSSTQVTDFEEVEIFCGKLPSGKFYDLEFGSCHVLGTIGIKNYSSNWYEIVQSQGEITLIRPAQETAIGVTEENKKEMTKVFLSCRTKQECPGFQTKVIAKRYIGTPSRKMVVSCDSKPIAVWNIGISPRCTAEGGTYVDIAAGVEYPVQITLGNGQTLDLKPIFFGMVPSEAYLTSSSRSMEFTITPKSE